MVGLYKNCTNNVLDQQQKTTKITPLNDDHPSHARTWPRRSRARGHLHVPYHTCMFIDILYEHKTICLFYFHLYWF